MDVSECLQIAECAVHLELRWDPLGTAIGVLLLLPFLVLGWLWMRELKRDDR